VMFADEPGERILVPAPKRVEERRFIARPVHAAGILPRDPRGIRPADV
jgi:hypothetical protein